MSPQSHKNSLRREKTMECNGYSTGAEIAAAEARNRSSPCESVDCMCVWRLPILLSFITHVYTSTRLHVYTSVIYRYTSRVPDTIARFAHLSRLPRDCHDSFATVLRDDPSGEHECMVILIAFIPIDDYISDRINQRVASRIADSSIRLRRIRRIDL